ncbi:ubiquitin carboxyl-terminal hydrolase-like protein [Podospora appendiculata]|uniref:ubiquitinyl hydrolase 1 n=1 Tax=Podospora appendiculata TaxID=314037 RepID=A0AAE0XBK5_9PEZI|nr:ubiquitin carboxyl-terminal hydrolase-like protein [Podospora appendiculata]
MVSLASLPILPALLVVIHRPPFSSAMGLTFKTRDAVVNVADVPVLVKSTTPCESHPAGRLAPRLIKDWFVGALVETAQGGNTSDWACPSLRDRSRPDVREEHELCIIQSQSYLDPDSEGSILLSCICRYCRNHFAFKISQGCCGKPGFSPLHHFLTLSEEVFDSIDVDSLERPKYGLYPLSTRVRYTCSACDGTVVLELTAPRLKPEWIQLITDQKRIRESLRKLKAEDPDRYKDVSPERETSYAISAPSTLNQYLKNVLEDDGTGPQKRISFRNKTFAVQFGPACHDLFRYLEFSVQEDLETGESFWLPPRLPMAEGKTPLRSYRAFYEDVRSEVQSLLDENPPQNQQVVRPISARDSLEKALRCDQVQTRHVSLADQKVEADDIRLLGATAGMNEDMLIYAYKRQVETDPARKTEYLKALSRLAERCGVMSLPLFVITEQTEAQTEETPADDAVNRAYRHFDIERDCREPSDYFIQLYQKYFITSSPEQKHKHRLALLEIAKDRNDLAMQAEAYMERMSMEEAYSFIGAGSQWPMDTIANFAKSLKDHDLKLIVMALETISSGRPQDDPNRGDFEQMFADIRSSASLTSSPSVNAERSGMNNPVGLGNLRNTCYLNSILQYFYSVNAVRNLVLDSDKPPLEPTETSVQAILHESGQAEAETGRAFVGYEFTRELSILFRSLDSSRDSYVTPRQRLANAALLRPERLRSRPEETAQTAGPSNTDAPPLPPRVDEGSELKITVDTVLEKSETASNVSSQTLVGQSEEDPSYVVVGRRAEKVEPVDIEMTEAPALDSAVESDAKKSRSSVEELAVELDKPNVGSDQMDVDEVMGNAIDHLRAAFKIGRIGHTDPVPDPIEAAFFSTFIDNRKKINEPTWNRSTRSDRWVTAYPAKTGKRDLYEALGNSFDLEPLPPDLLSFTTIDRPAPNFHICIQRSDGVDKNVNPIVIPETLYLDRFMHANDADSTLFNAQKRSWDIKTRLNEMLQPARGKLEGTELKGQASFLRDPPVTSNATTKMDTPGHDEVDDFLVIDRGTSHDGHEDWDVIGEAAKEILDKYFIDSSPLATIGPTTEVKAPDSVNIRRPDIDEFWRQFELEQAIERENLIRERDLLFKDMKKIAYRLHAVICHVGTTARAGHYWVWIHDFKQDVWRRYNDTEVSVHPEEHVFQELNTKGEPYYLAYVMAEDVEQDVGIPRRAATETQDVEMKDAVANESETGLNHASHVEDVDTVDMDDDVLKAGY